MVDRKSATWRDDAGQQTSVATSRGSLTSDDESVGHVPDRPSDEGADLGDRIRRMRSSKGLSLKDLAVQAGLSRAFVGQIERNQASPSVASVSRIAKALGVTLSELFAVGHNGGSVVRRNERIRITYAANKYADEVLTPSVSGRLLVLYCTIEPGADSGHDLYMHDADEECVVLMQGTLEVVIEDEIYTLEPGDALTFSSRRNHGFRNVGTEEVQAFWIMTPGRF
jgi:transcriptional regulator with XRE-family HTH domain